MPIQEISNTKRLNYVASFSKALFWLAPYCRSANVPCEASRSALNRRGGSRPGVKLPQSSERRDRRGSRLEPPQHIDHCRELR